MIKNKLLYIYTDSVEHYYLGQVADNCANMMIEYDKKTRRYYTRWQLDPAEGWDLAMYEVGGYKSFDKALSDAKRNLRNFQFSMDETVKCCYTPEQFIFNNWMLKVKITPIGIRALKVLNDGLVWDTDRRRMCAETSYDYVYYMHRTRMMYEENYKPQKSDVFKINNRKIRNKILDTFYQQYKNTVLIKGRRYDAIAFYEEKLSDGKITRQEIDAVDNIINKELRAHVKAKLVYFKLIAMEKESGVYSIS